MQLENEFVVPVGVDQAWAALNDPRRVAPCFPGATLESVDGDAFTGSVKLKLGPISMLYKGKGTFVERDDAAHRVVIDATGRDSRGGGHAKATITGTLTADGPSTAVRLVTDLAITGKPAQLGRGLIADVSNRIVDQFAACLATTLAAAPTEPTDAEPPTAASRAAAETGAVAATAGAAVPEPVPAAQPVAPSAAQSAQEVTPQPPMAPTPVAPRGSAEAIDLLNVAGASVAKRLVPALVIVAVIVAVGVWLITR